VSGVTLERSRDHWLVRLERPPLNALDIPMLESLTAMLEEAAASDACRALVLCGNRDAFSAGIDTKAAEGYDRDQRRALARAVNRVATGLFAMPKPTVAAIAGHSLGGGLVLALACDFRLAARGTYTLGLPEIRAGIPYPSAAMCVVTASLDPDVARPLVLSGETFGPLATVASRFLDAVVPPARLTQAATERARSSARLGAYEVIKRQLKSEVIARMQSIVDAGDDPVMEPWANQATQP
jgi:enoyl-CoA hydratase